MQNGVHKITMKQWLNSSYLSSANQRWITQLYKKFLINPCLVNDSWHFTFRKISNFGFKIGQSYSSKYNHLFRLPKKNKKKICKYENIAKQLRVFQLIDAYRFYGHRRASLDPLGLREKDYVVYLDPQYHDLNGKDFHKTFNVDSFAFGKDKIKLRDLICLLKKIYCNSIGAEYMHINSMEEKHWIQQRIESLTIRNTIFSANEKRRFLSELISAEEFERHLGIKFPGAKRFSLEGSDVLIPMLKDLIRHAGSSGTREVVLGMTHRGRLNVLVNVLGKKPQDLFDEFTGKYKKKSNTNDVKYHMGFCSNIEIEGRLVHLVMVYNPSHLEIINPVVIGSVRAKLDRLSESNSNKVLPVNIHGDAAMVGQGVVQETLNMSKLRGYKVGGTIHIVINNQIGFTTSSSLSDSRSNFYCTDIGKMIGAPIFHVNADDLESVTFVTRLALDYRNNFKNDVFIDLFCYRRHGHSESDEPNATQPLMYQKIKEHPTLSKIYADKLKAEKIIVKEDSTEMTDMYRNALDTGECVVKEIRPIKHSFNLLKQFNYEWNKNFTNEVDINHLQKLAKHISTVPKYIELHPRVAKIYANRQSMATGNKSFDWGGAEMLAYATLVDKGISVRLSGEDVERGTFFQRHAVVYSQTNGSTYIPLQHLHNKQGKFKVWNSILSEEAVLAFEYGYSTAEPYTLTIWEAQFGDFANGAQVVIDQFISSGEKKWGYICNLVMLLPHGYEGQGPEHSSARLERYLQLCAEYNMQVCIPSTPAQIYHVLRRQMLSNVRRPLIVMSPKSLLRHPLAVSSINDLSNSTFLQTINEIDKLNPAIVRRVILCSGKVYYDLLEQRRKNSQKDVAIMRIEQLYPFPHKEIQNMLKPYSHVYDFIWCQEEPLNQGAWTCNQNYIRNAIPLRSSLICISRSASASPAAGDESTHKKEQQDLVSDALNVN